MFRRTLATMGKVPVIREAAPAPSKTPASVIILHGLGDSGEGWRFIANEAHKVPQLKHIDFVLPSAPHRLITAFQEHAPGWFDVIEFGGKAEDPEGIKTTLGTVRELIKAETDRGVPLDRIVLGGFSQGAAMTAATALTLPDKLAGFIIMSGWLPIEAELKKVGKEANQSTPVLAMHGTRDHIVPYAWGKKSAEVLKDKYGFKNLEFKSYAGVEHSIDLDGIADIFSFLSKTLPAN